MRKTIFALFAMVIANAVVAQGKVNFQGEIANRNGDTVYIKNSFNKVIKKIVADKKGKFKDSFEVKDGFYVFFDGQEYSEMYLKAGYDLHLKMDAKQFDESIVYTGVGSDENNFLAQNTINSEKFGEETANLEKEAFNKKFEEKKKSDAERLEKGNFDETFKSTIKKNLTNEYFGILMSYNSAQNAKKALGKPAPSFDYVNYAGGKSKLEDFKGKYVYIDVWATWCGPCRGEIPFLQKIEEKYHDKNITFISISVDVDKDFEKWKKFVADKSLGGVQLFADKNWESDFIKAFGINSIPRFILIDPNGVVVEANAARPSDPALQEQLDKLLK